MDIDFLNLAYAGSLLATRCQDGFERITPPRQASTDWLLLYSLAGSGHLQFSSGQRKLEQGRLICCAPGTVPLPGTAADKPGWDLILIRFHSRQEWHSWVQWPQQLPGVGVLEISDEADRAEIERALELLAGNQQASGTLQDALSVNLLERVLLLGQKHHPSADQARLDPRIARSIKEIHSTPRAELDIDRLASIANVSRSRFSHLFREQTGASPQQYVENHRMHTAMHLLANSRRRIQDIASEVGYDDAFYFSTRFKRRCGMSPRRWRNAMRGANIKPGEQHDSSPDNPV